MKIGDKIQTEEVGAATVVDLFVSETSGKVVVQLRDESEVDYYYSLEELTLC